MIEFKEIKDDFVNQYNIRKFEIYLNNEPTKRYIITKTSPTGETKLVNITGSFYKIIPNEIVLQIADEVFKEWNTNPLNIDKPAWTQINEFKDYSKARHVISNGIRLHAYYKYGEEKVGDDTIYFGVNVINSIDGTTKLGLGGFTYRVKCQNQVLFGQRAFNILLKKQNLRTTRVKRNLIEGELIERIVRRHTKTNFPDTKEIETIFSHFDKIVASLKEVIEIYRNLQTIYLNGEVAQRLVDNLPKKILPPYIKVPKKGRKVLGLTSTPNLWTTYNDITANIWHSQKGSLIYREEQFNNLHRVIAEVI